MRELITSGAAHSSHITESTDALFTSQVLLAMPPEQQRALAEEGDALKRQLLQKKENEKEAALFRAEMNKNAEERGLPTEADGEHLTKKVPNDCTITCARVRVSGPITWKRAQSVLYECF